ncbi:MAG: mannose-1-phosphate guanylyltransferase [Candidatus Levybacteria bacterium]|nr:mannose-1-phosphate guanylyltransferase [Candidatus Levybacteria bacterium]
MKIVVFAGGVGTRLWPLSRKSSPKQFEKIVGDKSTLQLAVERLTPTFSYEDIYVSTGYQYKDAVLGQLPQIKKEHFIFEPTIRDVGPAVGLAMAIVAKRDPSSPIGIVWSDHFVKKERRFREVLTFAKKLIEEKGKNTIVFIGQRARFANQNLGWIEFGKEAEQVRGTKIFHFKKLIYRPSLEQAEKFLESGSFAWNPGYFVTTPSYLLSRYEKFAPQIYKGLIQIQDAYGTDKYEDVLNRVYPTLEKISFDDAILHNIDPKDAFVIAADLSWSDVGAWEALKEALEVHTQENVVKGKTMVSDSSDNLVFNYTDQLVVGIDLEEMLVINTDDVLLVCSKKSVPKIKKIVESFAGTPHEHLT